MLQYDNFKEAILTADSEITNLDSSIDDWLMMEGIDSEDLNEFLSHLEMLAPGFNAQSFLSGVLMTIALIRERVH